MLSCGGARVSSGKTEPFITPGLSFLPRLWVSVLRVYFLFPQDTYTCFHTILVFGIIGARKSNIGPLTSIYLMYGGSGYTDVAAALSLLTNLAATSLIAFKAL